MLAGTLDGRLEPRQRAHDTGKERVGQLLVLQGKEHEPAEEFGAGDIGAVAKLKESATGDVLARRERQADRARRRSTSRSR